MINRRGWIVVLIWMAVAMAYVLVSGRAARADDPKLPNGANCDMIRAYVAEHGRMSAVAWAVRNGYTWPQIRLAQRCLRE